MNRLLRCAIFFGLSLAWVTRLSAQSPAGAQNPAVGGMPVSPPLATDPLRVRLPDRDWREDSDTTLPPPPGWIAAEFASLSSTMGSSPESESLDPGDELTMETGRIASHKEGFFQKFSMSAGWIGREGLDDLGMVEARSFLTVAVPLPSRDFPMLITTGFDATPLDGPGSPDLPSVVYDAYLDFMWLPKLSDRWLGILALTPGVYSDFDDLQDAAYRVKAKALVRYDWIPNRVQVAAGVLYLHRFTVNWLPAGGIIWDPHDDVHMEILFPRPKFAYRYTASALHEDWAYLAGEFGGDTWSIRRGPQLWDMMEIVDWRIFAGIERKRPGGAVARLEIGYVFSRRVEFESQSPDYVPANTVMIRSGWEF
ncbi:MAG: hypothetical protein ACYC0X_25950 [Pirellulaceae bacterium]